MTDADQRELRLVFTQLEAFTSVNRDYVSGRDGEEYNRLVTRLIELGYDVSDFLISEQDIITPVGSYNSITKEVYSYRNPTVRHGVFHRKLESLLRYFELSQDAVIVSLNLERTDDC